MVRCRGDGGGVGGGDCLCPALSACLACFQPRLRRKRNRQAQPPLGLVERLFARDKIRRLAGCGLSAVMRRSTVVNKVGTKRLQVDNGGWKQTEDGEEKWC